ncbi:DUF397 domain-containing protein [Streptomyces olivaceus]
MPNSSGLYELDLSNASFTKACGGPCSEGCVTLARIGDDAWALGDSKRPGAEPPPVTVFVGSAMGSPAFGSGMTSPSCC